MDRDYFWVLALESFHPKDYYRQVCLEEIADYPNVLSFLMLHPSGWVGQVRLAAIRAVLARLEIYPLDELFITMMALDRVKRPGGKDDRTADTLPVFHGDDWLPFAAPQLLYQAKGPGI